MKSIILLLCLAIASSKPADQQNKTVFALSDEAVQYLKSLPSKFDELLSKFIQDLRKVVKDDVVARAALAEIQKPKYSEHWKKIKDSPFWKTVVREAKKYDTLFAHFSEKNPIDSLKDLAQEHPGVKAEFSHSSAIKSVIEEFDNDVLKLIAEEKRLIKLNQTQLDLAEEAFMKVSGLELPEDTKEAFIVIAIFSFPVERVHVNMLFEDLIIKKYLVDNGLLKLAVA